MPDEGAGWHENSIYRDMVKSLFGFLFVSFFFFSCNNKGTDSVEKADSANQAKLDSGLKRNAVVVDENSSNFLVRAAALMMELYVVSAYFRQQAEKQPTKDFMNQLYEFQRSLCDTILALAFNKNIVLPADSTMGIEVIDGLKNGKGNLYDGPMLSYVIKAHEKAIPLFENAILDAKDPAIRSFADKTVPQLRAHLVSVKGLDKRL